MENGRQAVGSNGRPMASSVGLPLPGIVAQPLEASISLLRGLASAGYFNAEQLSKMELILRGGTGSTDANHHWLTIAESCRYARISRSTLRRYAQDGLIRIRRLKGRRLVDQHELESMIVAKQDEREKGIPCSS